MRWRAPKSGEESQWQRKKYKYLCISTNKPDINLILTLTLTPTTRQRAVENIKLNIDSLMSRVFPVKFMRDNVIVTALFLLPPVVIITLSKVGAIFFETRV